MAFDLQGLNRTSSGANSDSVIFWAYASSTDTAATIVASGYFNSIATGLNVNEIIYVQGSDAAGFYKITAVSPNVTVTAVENYVENYSSTTITTAQVLALTTAPITLVAAPGANKMLEFVSAQLFLDYNSIGYTEAGDNLVIGYVDESGVAASQVIECTGFIDQTADTFTNAMPAINVIGTTAEKINVPLVIYNNNADFAAGNSPLIVKTVYRVHDFS